MKWQNKSLSNRDLLRVIENLENDENKFKLCQKYQPFWQTTGGYIELAKKEGIIKPTQKWHLFSSWAGGANPDSTYTLPQLRCAELILYIAETLSEGGLVVSPQGLEAGVEAARKEVSQRKALGYTTYTSAASFALRAAYERATSRNLFDDISFAVASYLKKLERDKTN